MSRYTPGPWTHIGGANKTSNYDRIYRALVSVTSGSGKDFVEHKVAYALGEDLQTCRANARLIAAAPEMLTLLRRLIEEGSYEGDYVLHHQEALTHEEDYLDAPAIADARALLARIEVE
jgi:hypothetical protein